MKKVISLLVVFCIIASTFCVAYAADWIVERPGENDAWGEYKWKVENNTLYLDYYGSNATDGRTVVFDWEGNDNNGKIYTRRPWETYAQTVTAIVITGNPTRVGAHQFRNMQKVTSVTLAGTEDKIEGGAFWDCRALGPQFVVPASVKAIGNSALINTSIVHLIFAETTNQIEITNLAYMGRLRNITLMRPIKKFGRSTMHEICGDYAGGVYGMTNPANVNVLVTNEGYFTKLKELPAYTKDYAINDTTKKTEYGMPVGKFEKCTVIDSGQTIGIANDIETKLWHIFYTENGGELTVEFLASPPNGGLLTIKKEDVFAGLASRTSSIRKMVFSAGFDTISEYFSLDNAYDKNQLYPNVKEIVLPSMVEYIGPYAFYNMTNLQKVNFEDTRLTAIDTAAFRYAPIKNITLPTTIKAVFNEVFTDNTALETLYLPVTANTTIRQYAFGARKASDAYSGKTLNVTLDGVCNLTPSKFEIYKVCELAFANEEDGTYRDTTLTYDDTQWSTAPSFEDVTVVAE